MSGSETAKKKRSRLPWIILGAILVLGGSGAALGMQSVKETQTQFNENIAIDTVNVGGMTVEEAVQAVAARIDEQAAAEWNFTQAGENYPVTARNMIDMPEDIESVVQNVWDEMPKDSLLDVLQKKLFKKPLGDTKDYPLAITYNQAALEAVAADWHARWNQEPQNASVSFNGGSFQVTPEQDGRVVNEAAAFAQLPQVFADIRDMSVEVPLEPQKAEITAEQWQNIGQLATFSTNYNPGQVDRTHNMSLAVNKINGTVLYPGDEFSFNNHVGVRSAAAGYREAQVIANGAYKPELGGGICQVASTLYNGALLSGLQITERHNHALDVTYVTSGRDATVYYGSLDFRFKNSNQYPIYVGMQLGGGTLTVTMYGNLNEKKNISISTVLDSTIAYPTEYQIDDSLTGERVIQGGANGKVVRSFRNYLDAAGNVTYQESLGESYYQPMARIVARPSQVTTAEPAEVEPTPTVSPETPAAEPVPEIPVEPVNPTEPPIPAEPEVTPPEIPTEPAPIEPEPPIEPIPAEPLPPAEPAPAVEPAPEPVETAPADNGGLDPNVDPFGDISLQ